MADSRLSLRPVVKQTSGPRNVASAAGCGQCGLAVVALIAVCLAGPARAFVRAVTPPGKATVQRSSLIAQRSGRVTHRPLFGPLLTTDDLVAIQDSGLVFVPETTWTLNPADCNRIRGGLLNISPLAFTDVEAGTECSVPYYVLAVETPQLTGLSFDSALVVLAQQDLNAGLAQGSDSGGMVVSQIPESGTSVISAGSVLPEPHGTIVLTLSVPSAPLALPDLVGLSLDSARSKLRRMGLASQVVIQDTSAEHWVTETKPGAGTLASPDRPVVIEVGRHVSFGEHLLLLVKLLLVVTAAFGLAFVIVVERRAIRRFLTRLGELVPGFIDSTLVSPLARSLERLDQKLGGQGSATRARGSESRYSHHFPRRENGDSPIAEPTRLTGLDQKRGVPPENEEVEAPVEVLDLVTAHYNDCLRGGVSQEFLQSHLCEIVDVDPDSIRPEVQAGKQVLRFLPLESGRFMIVQSENGNLLLPHFSRADEWRYDEVEMCFGVATRGEPGDMKMIDIVKVNRPGVCKREKGRWSLVRKGEITVVV